MNLRPWGSWAQREGVSSLGRRGQQGVGDWVPADLLGWSCQWASVLLPASQSQGPGEHLGRVSSTVRVVAAGPPQGLSALLWGAPGVTLLEGLCSFAAGSLDLSRVWGLVSRSPEHSSRPPFLAARWPSRRGGPRIIPARGSACPCLWQGVQGSTRPLTAHAVPGLGALRTFWWLQRPGLLWTSCSQGANVHASGCSRRCLP